MKINLQAAARLKKLREDSGFESAKAFADQHGISDITYRSHENGTRNISIGAAKKYARLLQCSYYWILDGLEGLEGGVTLNDGEMGLVDAMKILIQVCVHSNLVSPEGIINALSFQREAYRQRGLWNGEIVLKELMEFAARESKQPESDVVSRLLFPGKR